MRSVTNVGHRPSAREAFVPWRVILALLQALLVGSALYGLLELAHVVAR